MAINLRFLSFGVRLPGYAASALVYGVLLRLLTNESLRLLDFCKETRTWGPEEIKCMNPFDGNVGMETPTSSSWLLFHLDHLI